jgi:hypothetical protein
MSVLLWIGHREAAPLRSWRSTANRNCGRLRSAVLRRTMAGKCCGRSLSGSVAGGFSGAPRAGSSRAMARLTRQRRWTRW